MCHDLVEKTLGQFGEDDSPTGHTHLICGALQKQEVTVDTLMLGRTL